MADSKNNKAKAEDRRKPATTDPVVAATIGAHLKRLYNQAAEEPVPDRFTRLLEDLAGPDGDRNRE